MIDVNAFVLKVVRKAPTGRSRMVASPKVNLTMHTEHMIYLNVLLLLVNVQKKMINVDAIVLINVQEAMGMWPTTMPTEHMI